MLLITDGGISGLLILKCSEKKQKILKKRPSYYVVHIVDFSLLCDVMCINALADDSSPRQAHNHAILYPHIVASMRY